MDVPDALEASKRGLLAENTAASMEDPLAVLKRGYRVALGLSAVGVIFASRASAVP